MVCVLCHLWAHISECLMPLNLPNALQPHFGYGLKEAASRLGICPTTLKRTCR